MLIAIAVIVVALVVAFTILLAVEQHDKEKRQRLGLPAKKYHDITDMDVTTVYTIKHK